MRRENAGQRSATQRHHALAIGLLACLLTALAPEAASASSGLNVAPVFPASVSVGATGLHAEVILTNANTSPDVASTICSSGDGGACTGSKGITLTPSCSAIDFTQTCTPSGADPGDFSVTAATGATGSACAATTFTVSTIDPTFGTIRLSPNGGNVVLPTSGSSCHIALTFDVVKLPADADPGTTGIQTLQSASASAVSDHGSGAFNASSGSPVTTVKLAAPALTATSPASPANNNSPAIVGTAGAGTTQVSIYKTADCSGTPVVQGTAAAFASPGLTVGVADNTSTDFRATATDAAGGVSACSAPITYVEDSIAPAAPTVGGTTPSSPANNNSPHVTGTAETGSTVQIYTNASCSGVALVSGTAASYASPGLIAPVPDNSTTTFYSTATDAAGNHSACSPIGTTYVEDSIAPSAPTITGSDPASPANYNTPRIIGNAPTGTTVTVYTNPSCTSAVAGTGTAAAYATPGILVTVPDNSSTTFYSTATDAAGNASPCSSTAVTYVEDSNPPGSAAVTSSTPSSPANDNSPRIKGAAQSGSTVRLYTDASCSGTVAAEGTAAAFASPGISVSVADDSTTTFYARAIDTSSNASPCSTSSVTYVEDSTAPQTTIDSGPTTGASSTPTFTFSSSEAGATFQCRIDFDAFAACTSPFTSAALAAGTHTFEVRAIDAAGNVDPTSAGRTFTVGGGGATVTPPPPPPPSTVPAQVTPQVQVGCIGVKGKVYLGTVARNVRNGSAATDIMFGLAGNDVLRGLAGKDCVYGGPGKDLLSGGSGNDHVYGGTGNDRISGGAGNDVLSGDAGNDRIDGGAGNDRLTGGAGNDTLVDRRGRDRFSGGSGKDRIDARDATLAGRRVPDRILCGAGVDTVLADPIDTIARDCERSHVIRRSLKTIAAR